ncbi:hypothetical protein OBV_15850 [Oscillibacter valericigenes Sjm18-20]|nr:hypothetical protein OBV_15850 [Oscillibacter valericigenes Sjm18-20]
MLIRSTIEIIQRRALDSNHEIVPDELYGTYYLPFVSAEKIENWLSKLGSPLNVTD